MKKLFLIASLLLVSILNVSAQDRGMKYIIDNTPITNPPTSDMSKVLSKRFYIAKEYRKFPDKIYEDFQCTRPVTYSDRNEYCAAMYQFRQSNAKYTVLGIGLGESEIGSMLLATYDLNGNQLDWLEVSVSFGDIILKEFKISMDMKVSVYQIKPTSTTPILYSSLPTSFNGQRIDTVYQIDANGKFVKQSEQKYQPQNYTIAALIRNKYIFNGTETPLR